MMTLILFGFFFLLVILNVPIGVSLGLAASIGLDLCRFSTFHYSWYHVFRYW